MALVELIQNRAVLKKDSLFIGASIAVILLTALIHLNVPIATNVSWLLVIGAKLIGGEHLYTDIIEINPPASVFLYLPAAWLEHCFGVRAEFLVLIAVVALTVASIAFSGRILASRGLIRERTVWLLAGLIAFGLITGDSFAEREHIAVVMLLPLLALATVRMRPDATATLTEAILAGVAAGVAISIKPHFAAAVALPQLYSASRIRFLGSIFCVENYIMTAVFCSYVISVFLFFPEFFSNIFPLAREVYLQVRLSSLVLIFKLIPFIIITTFYFFSTYRVVARRPLLDIYKVLLCSSAGFAIAYLVQGKIWEYHYFPAVALCVFAVLDDILNKFVTLRAQGVAPGRCDLAHLVAMTWLLLLAAVRFFPASPVTGKLDQTIAKSFAHPRILAIGGDLAISHPLTREVDGHWTGRLASQFISEYVRSLLKTHPDMDARTRESLENRAREDRSILIEDLRKGAPDVLLIDTRALFVDWIAWVKEDPELLKLLCSYERVDHSSAVALYRRRPASDQALECVFP